MFFLSASVSKSLLIVLGTLPFSWSGGSSTPAAQGLRALARFTLARRSGAGKAFSFPLFCKFYRMPVCPCQGSWRNNQLLRLCVKCPIWDCLAWRRSLDNSCPSSCCRKASGKTKLYFLLCEMGAWWCSWRPLQPAPLCTPNPIMIQCAPLVRE